MLVLPMWFGILDKKLGRVFLGLFRAKRTDSETYLQLLYDGDSFESGRFLCEHFKRSRNGLQSTKLSVDRRVPVQIPAVVDLTVNNEEVADEVQPTQMDLDSQDDENGEAAKRNAEGSGIRKRKGLKLKVNPYHPVSDAWKMKDKEAVFFKVLPSQSKKVAVASATIAACGARLWLTF